ncbi:protein FAM200B-like [Octopus sinensis]|uniref:Protein FAM200B-like n=1 Tax=Octopus sinensis TaxID=2607531 RepID=A0A6P7TUG6_9MOLL|nr:protein FAM200B-like [Octopus sinensis]
MSLPVNKIRKYNDSYLNYGFYFVIKNGVPHPQCIICQKIICPESMKPSLLSRHQVSNHFETIGKPNDFFKNKKDNIRKIDDSFNFDINFLLSKLSYMISYRIAKAKKPHTIAENLIIPCIKDMFNVSLAINWSILFEKFHVQMIPSIEEYEIYPKT